MGYINLYKIRSDKRDVFFEEVEEKFSKAISVENISFGDDATIGFTLHLPKSESEKDLAWKWVFSAFGQKAPTALPMSKAIITTSMPQSVENSPADQDKSLDPKELEDDSSEETNQYQHTDTYAITFGSAFFLADKYCDRDFGFSFARKLDYKTIKTTTLLSPYSKKNKTVNSYVDFSSLEFDSGESFAKIKANITLPAGSSLFQDSIQMGSSIKFSVSEDSLERIAGLIKHVENTLQNTDDKHKIPVFVEVKDKDLINRLNANLSNSINPDDVSISFSEFDIIGASEIFNSDFTFQLKYGRRNKKYDSLTVDNLNDFCSRIHLNNNYDILDIKVVSLREENSVRTDRIRDLIDHTDDNEQCLLSKGKWYHYNSDFLDYLRDSIAEIDVAYDPRYDFTDQSYQSFLDSKYTQEHNQPEYAGLDEAKIRERIKKKYYREYSFNIMRADAGFSLQDRSLQRVDGHPVEVSDLYHPQKSLMFAVKFGKSSSALTFVLEQSLNTVNLYKHKMLDNVPKIETAGIWIVLDRNDLPDLNGKPDLNDLKMLMFKNRLDEWKKEVRLAGLRPLVYVNYIR